MDIPVSHLCLLLSIATAGVWHRSQAALQASSTAASSPAHHLGSYLSGRRGRSRSCFQEKCTCSHRTADCSHNEGRLSFIPRLPKGILYVLFSFNDLTRIDNDTFFNNVTGIVSLDLSHNGLMSIHPTAFQRLRKLRYVNLDHNRLTYPAMASVLFSPSLEQLSARSMGLGPIPPGFFSRSPMSPLKFLRLNGNPIQSLNMSEFSPLVHLSSLEVADCRIIIITGAFLPQLNRLNLKSNALFDLSASCDSGGSSLLPNLHDLNVAGNMVSGFDTDVCLPELTSLDLSRSPFSVMRTDMFNGSLFPQLATLSLQNIQTIQRIEQFAFRSSSLERLSLMYCNLPFSNPIIHPDSFRGIPRLVYLQLSHNLGSYLPDVKFEQLFGHLENLQDLNLGTSGIQEINENLFRNMSHLTALSLYRNKLTVIPDGMFRSLKHLKMLKLSDNELTGITESTFSEETRGRLKQLDLSGNLFVCDCSILWFKDWLASSPIFNQSYRGYTCSNIPNMPLLSFTMNPQACLLSRESCSVITACFFVFLVLLSFVSAVHHYRWHIRLRLAFKGHGDIMRRRLQTRRFDYDIFLSFAGEDLPWVRQHLLPRLEGKWGLRVCVHERDFIPGKNILSNIVDSVKASKKYVMLFSSHFVVSPWCQFELDLCLGQVVDHDDALIVVCLDDVTTSRHVTSTMAAVLKTTTYLQWRNTRDDVTLFWRRMGLAVRDLTS